MCELPLISIICLSWNHEKYVEQGMQSLINQTYHNVEIVFLDNDSSDNSYRIGKKILEKSSANYKIHRFTKNIGGVRATNYAIRNLCAGEYICIMALDDWLDHRNCELKMDFLLKNPEYGLVYSYGHYYFEEENRYQLIAENLEEGWVFEDLLKRNFLFMMGTVVRKEVYDKIGLFNEKNTIEDWDFTLRATQIFPVGLVRIPLFFYRQHSSNYSKGSHKYYKDCLAVIGKYKSLQNQKIGHNWIKSAYLDFILKSTPDLSGLKYLLTNMQFNMKSMKTIVKYCLDSYRPK